MTTSSTATAVSCTPALLLALLQAAILSAAGAVQPTGYYQFVAGSNASPYFYPPLPHHGAVRGHAFHGLGQGLHGGVQDGPFLTGWDRERDLYSSRYAASALPVPLPAGMAFPVGPVNVANSPSHNPGHRYEPAQRLFGIRGRPALVPTPYLKFSSHAASASADKGKYLAGHHHQNSLAAFPEPGFYGRSGSSGLPSGQPGQPLAVHSAASYGMGHGYGYGYPETASVGFYGKPT